MQRWILKKIAYIPIHLIVWGMVWLFFIYFFSYNTDNKRFVHSFATSLMPITILVSYIISEYLIPTYLVTKKYGLFAAYLVYTMVCSLFLIIILTFVTFVFISDFDLNRMPPLARNFLVAFILVYLVAGIFSFTQILRSTHKTAQQNTQLEKQLLQGQLVHKQKELHYLKEQIHPHFLFNTLNTIYGAALKQADETPDLILKLSNLLDYTLNQIEKPTVKISEEIAYIESHIGLEKVRFKDSLHISFHTDVHKEIHIPPMLFIAFIENAFKHGGTVDGYLHIELSLNLKNNKLEFYIKNSLNNSDNTPSNHGLGLENSRKRLDALYPNAYSLSTSHTESWFTLHLEINLPDAKV